MHHRRIQSVFFLLDFALLLTMPAVCHAATLYVSTSGRAGWSGDIEEPNAAQTDGPLPTLTAARDRIRALHAAGNKAAVTVLIRGGTYQLSEPFVLEPRDSGTADAPVTYAAYPGELPIFSGGRVIEGWKQAAAADSRNRPGGKEIWTAPAPWEFRQLFVDGQRAMRARIPHESFYRIEGTSSGAEDHPFRLKYRGNDILSAWAELGNAEAVVLPHWTDLRMQIAKVDEAQRVALLSGIAFPSGQERIARYFIENVPDGMWKPGNWYLDRKTQTVSYWAQRGQDVAEAEVIAPVLRQLVLLKGKPETGELVRNVVLRGLDFRHTDWMLGPRGYTSQQAAITVPAALEVVGAEGIVIEHCRFTQMGGFGIQFGPGTKHNRIVANEIFDMGAGGIKLGLPIHVNPQATEGAAAARMRKLLEDEARASSANTISDNLIYDLGLVFPEAVGIWVGQSDGNTIAHNHVHDLYYSGISVGWTWGFGPSRARNNTIEYNHVHHVGKNQMLSDMGGIYTLGTQPGTVVRNNLIHDVDRFSYGGWGIYTDGGSSKMLYENNVVYNCKSSPFNQNYGREQTVRNNVFAFGNEYQIRRSERVDPQLPFTFERNIIYYAEGDVTDGEWCGAGLRMDQNVFWDVRGGELKSLKRAWQQWETLKQNSHSIIADPLFVAPQSSDFRLKPESPALKLGFQAIDMSTVGPREQAGPVIQSH
jgi:hypothetical protein